MPRNVTVTFDDGAQHIYNAVPDNATPEQVEQRATKEFNKKVKALDGGSIPTAEVPRPRVTREQLMKENPGEYDPESPEWKAKYGYGAKDILKDVGRAVVRSPMVAADAILNVGRNVVAAPVAGVVGTVTAPLGLVPGYEGVGARNVERVQRFIGGQPFTEEGKQVVEGVAYPFEKLAEGADWVATNTPGVNKSPLLQTGVNTGIQALPMLLFRGKGKGPTPAASASAEQAAAQSLGASVESVSRAKKYAADRMGANWDALSTELQGKIAKIAEDAKNLEALDPAALAREAKFQSLPVPVPATRGTLMRDPVAMRNEANAAGTKAGQPIYDTNLAANQALLDNLEVLKGKVSGSGETAATATTAEQTGSAVQGAARGKLELQKAKVKEAYEKADNAGETLQPVPDEGLLKVMEVVHDTVDQPHFSYAKSWLESNAKAIDAGKLTIRDIEKLRKSAVAKALNGGEDAFYAGELIKAIDKATEGAGGKLYQEARGLRKQQALEFEEQGAVSDLVSNASRTDRTTALENTTKSILNGSLEDVRKVKKTLLTGGDEATRTSGRKAWRDVRRQVIDDIKAEATKGVAPNKDGSPNLSPAALKRAIDRYGPEKLDEIFGPGTRKQLDKILDVARDAKTQPPRMDVGSSTVANILAFLGKGLDKVPVVGGPAVDIARGVAKVKEIGADARAAKDATVTPLNQALKKATKQQKRREVLNSEIDPKLVPLSQVGAEKNR